MRHTYSPICIILDYLMSSPSTISEQISSKRGGAPVVRISNSLHWMETQCLSFEVDSNSFLLVTRWTFSWYFEQWRSAGLGVSYNWCHCISHWNESLAQLGAPGGGVWQFWTCPISSLIPFHGSKLGKQKKRIIFHDTKMASSTHDLPSSNAR